MSQSRGPSGSITVICGSMFSGKTEELIRLVRRAMHARKRFQVFKSDLDTRCETTFIRTHDGASFHAVAVPDSRTIESLLLPDTQVVGIEEIQFLDEGVVNLCQRLADRGIHVIAAGLDQDFRGLPFSFMPALLALADNVMKLHAICMVCGEEASRTQRLVNGRPASWNEPTILIGAEESYEARCRRCHQVRNIPKQFRSRVSGSPGDTLSKEEKRNGRTPRSHANGRATSQHRLTSFNGYEGTGTSVPSEIEERLQLNMFPEIRADVCDPPETVVEE